MPAKTRQIKLTPTQPFLQWLETFAKSQGMTEGEALAYLCAVQAAKEGFTGDVMNKRGKYERK